MNHSLSTLYLGNPHKYPS